MKKPLFSLFAVFAFAGAISPAIAGEPVSFKYAGADFSAKVTELKNGGTLVAGREKTSGSTFRLTIREGQVRGLYNSTPVSFAVNEADKAQVGQVILLSQR